MEEKEEKKLKISVFSPSVLLSHSVFSPSVLWISTECLGSTTFKPEGNCRQASNHARISHCQSKI
ncbi:hypothetical protein D0A37_19940 [Microcoleus vaginatus HSN003]|nr:hypothetical protein D0A37_19940 [Microcoleus vaginatus HSN003]